MPEAGARSFTSCIVFNKDVIRLLQMVVVSWAGFGNQADGQTMKAIRAAHLSVTPRRLCQVALRANQQQASQLEMCTLTHRRYWRLSVPLPVCRRKSALDNAPSWRMRAAH